MVDLSRQYQKIKTEVDQAMARVIQSTAFIGGEDVRQFATELGEYLGGAEVIPCGNGTDALQIALMSLGLRPGDEVLTPSFTYIATVEVIALLGLKPVFVDVDPDYFTMDPQSLKSQITPRSRAIIPVHLYGQSAPMEEIQQLASEHQLTIIEDNAQALGGRYRYANGRWARTGTMGEIGCTSFFPSKNLGAYGDGGAMFTRDPNRAALLSMIANHGQKKRYFHEVVGCNSRLDSIQAAILRVKLRHLDEYNQARKEVAAYYDQAFSSLDGITTPRRAPYADHVFHQYTIKLEGYDRAGVQAYMADKGVPTMIYYPIACHKQPMLAAFQPDRAVLPITEALSGQVLSLPIHTELRGEELDFIRKTFIDALSQNRLS